MAELDEEKQQNNVNMIPDLEKNALNALSKSLQNDTKQFYGNISPNTMNSNDNNNINDNDLLKPFKVQRLDDICLESIANNFNEYPIIDEIPNEYIENLVSLIDLDKLNTNNMFKNVKNEKLFERMSCERWQNCKIELHGMSWKRLYIERHICNLLENYYPSNNKLINYTQLIECIKSCNNLVYKIELNQLPSHIDLNQILPLFNNLNEFNVVYKILNVGMSYDESLFGMKLTDALNLSKYLNQTKTLIKLSLCECLIDDETIHILCSGLEKNKTITSLNLSYNNISNVGCKRISKYLKNTNILKHLNLKDNSIGNEGCIILSDIIKNIKNLNYLNLSMNVIYSKGINAILNALSLNKSLTEFDISFNNLNTSNIPSLINMLKCNKTLKHFNISGNVILTNKDNADDLKNMEMELTKKEKESKLQDIFTQISDTITNDNKTLITFNVRYCGFSDENVSKLSNILRQRHFNSQQNHL